MITKTAMVVGDHRDGDDDENDIDNNEIMTMMCDRQHRKTLFMVTKNGRVNRFPQQI